MNSLKTGLVLLGLTLSSQAASILWVSDNGPKSTGTDGIFYPARAEDFTPPLPRFTDQDFVDLLIAAGHTVARFNPISNLSAGTAGAPRDVEKINGYDLIILGTALNSGPFNLQSRGAGWNRAITKPVIFTKSTLLHKQRMGLLTGNSEYDSAANDSTPPNGKLELMEPENPIFKGIDHAPAGEDLIETMTNYCGVRIPTPVNNRGTDFQFSDLHVNGVSQNIVNNVEGGGTVLARIKFNPMNPTPLTAIAPPGAVPSVEPAYVANGYAIVEWPKGAEVRHDSTQTNGPDTLGGYRLFFGCGTRDAAVTPSVTGAPNPQVGAMDLTPDGQRLFLNAVNRTLGLPFEITNIYASAADGEVNVTWNAAPGSSYSVYASPDLSEDSWTVVAGPITATLPSVTARITDQYDRHLFYRVGKN